MHRNVPLGLAFSLGLAACASWLLAAPAGNAPRPMVADAVQLIGESDDQAITNQTLGAYVTTPEAALVPFLQQLRETMLEHSSGRFRERARRSLVALLLARQEGATAINSELYSALLPSPSPGLSSAGIYAPLAATYQLATAGKSGADAALTLLAARSPGTVSDRALRLIAANSLALTGVNPSLGMITAVDAAIETEGDRETQAELLQTLAAFAATAPEAYQRLAQRLLLLKDCDLVQRTAMTLPAADLRLWIIKRLPGKDDSRGAQVRRWVRATTYHACTVTGPTAAGR